MLEARVLQKKARPKVEVMAKRRLEVELSQLKTAVSDAVAAIEGKLQPHADLLLHNESDDAIHDNTSRDFASESGNMHEQTGDQTSADVED